MHLIAMKDFKTTTERNEFPYVSSAEKLRTLSNSNMN